jgi:hypothetical protein
MGFVEYIRVRQKCPMAGICAKQNPPSAIFGAWIVGRIGIAEDTSAQSDKLFARFLFHRLYVLLLDFGDKDFEGTNVQFT